MIIDTEQLRALLSATEEAECKRLDATKENRLAAFRRYDRAERKTLKGYQIIRDVESLSASMEREAGG